MLRMKSQSLPLVMLVVVIARISGEVVKVGNDIVATDWSSGTEGTIHLLRDVVAQEGVFYGFSAFFRNRNPVILQWWGQVGGANSNTYQLKRQWRWVPNVIHAREDVYLHITETPCFRVQANDKIGIYHPQSPGTVAFEFDSATSLTMQYGWNGNLTAGPEDGTELTFDTLTYPYKFSLSAWIDTDLSQYGSTDSPACPTQLFIPNNGTIYSPTYTGNTEGGMGATGAAGQSGDTGYTGPEGSAGSTGPRGPNGPLGSTGHTGPIGVMGDTGHTGGNGATGSTGPLGSTGVEGLQGEVGAKGDTGEKGEQGPAGVNPMAAKYSNCPWCEKFVDAYVIMGVVIWLGVITLIFFIYAIINCCCKTGRRQPGGKYSSQDDLWRKYEKKGQQNENHYSEVEEGRTTF